MCLRVCVLVCLQGLREEDAVFMVELFERLDYGGLKLAKRCFFLCLHVDASSFLLLSVPRCLWHVIQYFSSKQRLHFFDVDEYELAFEIIFHLIE